MVECGICLTKAFPVFHHVKATINRNDGWLVEEVVLSNHFRTFTICEPLLHIILLREENFFNEHRLAFFNTETSKILRTSILNITVRNLCEIETF